MASNSCSCIPVVPKHFVVLSSHIPLVTGFPSEAKKLFCFVQMPLIFQII